MRLRLVLVGGLVLAACSGTTARPPTSVATAPVVGAVRLTPIASASEPVVLAGRAGDDALYVGERAGLVRPLRAGQLGAAVLDLRSQTRAEGERGLLGLAFAPSGDWLYAHYTNRDGDTRVDAYAFRDGRAEIATRREVLAQRQPFANHNGGELRFGPDGNLYLGLGDGGSQGDPTNQAQRLDTWLGKILRITPTPTATAPYSVPADNPFVRTAGARPEIWTYGLRNPWRFSFDRANGDLWVGDVGAQAREEIDWRAAGEAAGTNFGWSRFEGTRTASSVSAPDAVPPVFEYLHDEGGCSVTGGYVYRGARIPALRGVYLFADYCQGKVRGLRLERGVATEVTGLDLALGDIVSFGEDEQGEVYVLSLSGEIARIDPAG